MAQNAFWTRSDSPGADAAHYEETETGGRLVGTATFLHNGVAHTLTYDVRMARDWTVECARIEGAAGEERYRHVITRDEQGWVLDGEPMGLAELVDLDFGFTPATNFQQLHRLGLAIGERAAIDVAWFDVGQGRIIALPQIYKRVAEDRYAYEAPSVAYSAELAIAPSGFVADYPGLWRMAN